MNVKAIFLDAGWGQSIISYMIGQQPCQNAGQQS